MTAENSNAASTAGGGSAPRYREGPVIIDGDVQLRRRYFTYDTDDGLVVGTALNVAFVIDYPVAKVWPYFKDFNLWQNPHSHYYSGVLGDLEGRTFRISVKPDESGPHYYEVLRVIPEHLIVISQPIPMDGSSAEVAPGLGSGGVSPGFHVFMLNESEGKTLMTIFMEHKFRTRDLSEEQAFEKMSWTSSSLRRWQEGFVPTLKKLIHEGG